MTNTEPLPASREPRDLTYDQRIAAEAAFRGGPADPKWPASALAVYEGLVKAIQEREHERSQEAVAGRAG